MTCERIQEARFTGSYISMELPFAMESAALILNTLQFP
jgi:hypothetical protein